MHITGPVTPDFRNQGIWLRLLLAANGLMLVVALIGNRSLTRLPGEVTELAALVEPALAEAWLAALTARIRPHFFFNSLNAVLGVMRDDPRRAEMALEELGELFRALMRDNRALGDR